MHHQIDSLAYQNRLRFLPPSHKFIFAIFLFILGYLSPPLWQILIAVWLSIWIIVYAKIPYLTYLQMLGIPLSFWLMSLPALCLGVGLHSNWTDFSADVQWGIPLPKFYLYLSKQGIKQGITLLTRAIALTSSLYFILLTIPLSETLQLLQKMGFPRLIVELLALMYRFIFLLTDTVLELLDAQKARLGYINWKTSMKSLALVISQLLRRTLANYRQISLGLASRGFQGELKFWHSSRHRPSLRYGLEAIAGSLLLLISWGWYYLC
jgi:cobalt/nickel transport system permease protein